MNAVTKEQDHGQANASGWASSIAEMVAALEVDYERLEDLQSMQDDSEGVNAEEKAACFAADYPDETEELAGLIAAATIDGEEQSDADAVRERIQESPLSVEVRSGWASSAQDFAAEEFMILLSTGGPALRIMGELDEHCQPSRAWLEYQDWGTPWTHHYVKGFADTLLTFCQQFYFGE